MKMGINNLGCNKYDGRDKIHCCILNIKYLRDKF